MPGPFQSNPNNSVATNTGTTPIQYTQLTADDLKDPATFNTIFSQVFTKLNSVLGTTGPAQLANGVDVGGSTISNVGEPQSSTDAISQSHAESNYSASVLQPKLEAGGTHTLRTYRALNSKQQQEKYSTYLTAVSNTAPTTNTTTVQAGAAGGGVVSFTIPAGYHLRVDGSQAPFNTFTATVPIPTSQAINTITRTAAGVVTAFGTFIGLSAGQSILVTGVLDPTYDGTFILASVNPGNLVWNQLGQVAQPGSAGGTVTSSGVYYVYLKYPSQNLAISGPFDSDSQQHRLEANIDGQVMIAVVVVDASGVVSTQSAAGATIPIAQNNGNRIVARL